MTHHLLDPYPIPKDKGALFINEPWLADKSLNGYRTGTDPEKKNDNVRIYVPIDLNKEAIEDLIVLSINTEKPTKIMNLSSA